MDEWLATQDMKGLGIKSLERKLGWIPLQKKRQNLTQVIWTCGKTHKITGKEGRLDRGQSNNQSFQSKIAVQSG